MIVIIGIIIIISSSIHIIIDIISIIMRLRAALIRGAKVIHLIKHYNTRNMAET